MALMVCCGKYRLVLSLGELRVNEEISSCGTLERSTAAGQGFKAHDKTSQTKRIIC